MGLSMKLVFTLIIQLCPCFAGEVSKACFGSGERTCTYHNLRCSSGFIAIKEAFYMKITKCFTTGISACAAVNVSNIQLNGTRNNFSRSELDTLYNTCSTRPTCSVRARATSTAGFSAIIYKCINETIGMCNVTNIQRNDTSLIWRGPSEQNTCLCSISKPTTTEPTLLTLTALEMRYQCPGFTVIVVDETVARPCSSLTSRQLLLNSTNRMDLKLTVDTRNTDAVIWIGIQGTENFNIVCNESPTTTETASSVESTRTTLTWTAATQESIKVSSSFTSLRSSSVLPQDQTTTNDIGSEIDSTTTTIATHDKYTRVPETDGTTSPNATFDTHATVHKDADITTGTVVGIIVPLCIIIAGVVTAVIIFRRRKLRQKDENGKVVKPEPNPQEVYSLEKKFSPEYDYATTNEYLDLVPQTHTTRSPQNGDADDNHYHQVEPLQTKIWLPESNHLSGNKNDELNLRSSVRDCLDGNYHEQETQKELGSTEHNMASKMESHNVKTQPGKKGSSEYVLAGNISKGGKESQQAKKGSSDCDYTGGNTYHVLKRQSALGDSSDYDYAGGNDYHEVEPQEPNTSDYDYATCGNQQANHSSSRNTQTRQSDNDHFGRQPARANRFYDNTLSVACPSEGRSASEEVYSYNHLNEKAPSNVDADSTYNTTSSTRHKMDSSTNDMEDHYGYNHLGTGTKKDLPQNEYDTTAFAIRDIARMNGDMEDPTYDHAHLITSDCSPSGMINAGFQESDYDHASTTTAHKDECESNASPNRSHQEEGVADVYTIAGEADTNLYQLAK